MRVSITQNSTFLRAKKQDRSRRCQYIQSFDFYLAFLKKEAVKVEKLYILKFVNGFAILIYFNYNCFQRIMINQVDKMAECNQFITSSFF